MQVQFGQIVRTILQMNVFITGATGFLGRALTLRLRRDGHSVTALTRNPAKARSLLGTEATVVETGTDLSHALDAADAVVNLAGEPLLGARWDEEKKRRIRHSRVDFTRELVQAMKKAEQRPRVLISGSAVGIYGDREDASLTESSGAGQGFLADLCRDWEEAAGEARAFGTRVVTLRTGVVLGRTEGALAQMLPPFRLGLGGPVGPGSQYVPWIHIDDLVDLISTALIDEQYDGPVNGVGPNPVTFRALATALGDTLGRPSFMPVPTFALRILFGQAASVLTDSQRVIPEKALSLGFTFRFSHVDAALRDLLDNSFVSVGAVEGTIPDSEYLAEHPPAFLLQTRVRIERPVEEVFSFFSEAENLGLITPAGMQFRITSAPPKMSEGARISYRLKVGPVPLTWVTRIDAWEDGERFVDSQEKGPYASWWHEHRFEKVGTGTVMTDRVFYSPPAGPIGRIANHVYVADELRQVFGYRSAVLRRRFGAEMRKAW